MDLRIVKIQQKTSQKIKTNKNEIRKTTNEDKQANRTSQANKKSSKDGKNPPRTVLG